MCAGLHGAKARPITRLGALAGWSEHSGGLEGVRDGWGVKQATMIVGFAEILSDTTNLMGRLTSKHAAAGSA